MNDTEIAVKACEDVQVLLRYTKYALYQMNGMENIPIQVVALEDSINHSASLAEQVMAALIARKDNTDEHNDDGN